MKEITNLVAIVETPNGDTREQTIATKDGHTTFFDLEKQNALKKYYRILGKGYIVCDTYEKHTYTLTLY